MKKLFGLVVILVISGALACWLGSEPVQTFTPVAPLPTPLPETEGATLREAWQLAGPTVQAWATDAQMSQEFVCQGVLTPDGYCNQWYGVLASAAHEKVAELVIAPDRAVSISPVNTPIGRYLDNAFDSDGIIDSSQAAQQAWAWLEAQELKREDTRLRGLALRVNPGIAAECGRSPAYDISFFSPQGHLCLDPYSGQILSNSYGR